MIVLALVAAIAVVAAGAAVRWWTWRPVERRRARVQLDDGSVIDGLITSRRGPLLVLSDGRFITEKDQIRMDGHVVVERSRVSWLQVLD